MLKACEKLLDYNGTKNSMKVGSHRVEKSHNFEKYFYHWTCIYKVLHDERKIIIDNGGYGTSSTTRAINSYISSSTHKYYIACGYEVIDMR